MPRPLRPRLPAPLVLLRRQASGGTKGRGHTAPPPFGARPGDLVNVSSLPGPTGPIRVLELNRPHARNALSEAMLRALRGEIAAVQRHYDADGNEDRDAVREPTNRGPVRALIICSAVDSCFCAGADLKERRGFTPEQTAKFLTDIRETFDELAALPIPTISAVASIALGGGFELALATHFRVMATTAVVGLPETRLAIIPGAGGTHRLPPLVGPARARDLILTGRRVHGPEAFFLGLADRLVELGPVRDDKDLEEEGRGLVEARERTLSEAVALAHDICKGGPLAVRAALRAVARPSPDNEARQYQSVVATRDRDEALEAFAERRPPKFQGV